MRARKRARPGRTRERRPRPRARACPRVRTRTPAHCARPATAARARAFLRRRFTGCVKSERAQGAHINAPEPHARARYACARPGDAPRRARPRTRPLVVCDARARPCTRTARAARAACVRARASTRAPLAGCVKSEPPVLTTEVRRLFPFRGRGTTSRNLAAPRSEEAPQRCFQRCPPPEAERSALCSLLRRTSRHLARRTEPVEELYTRKEAPLLAEDLQHRAAVLGRLLAAADAARSGRPQLAIPVGQMLFLYFWWGVRPPPVGCDSGATSADGCAATSPWQGRGPDVEVARVIPALYCAAASEYQRKTSNVPI